MRLSELAQYLGGELVLNHQPDELIFGIGTLDGANRGEVSFLTNALYIDKLQTTKASAAIVPQRFATCATAQIIHKNPHYAMARAAQLFEKPESTFRGVSDLAFVSPTAKLGDCVNIHPFAYVGDEAELAQGVTIYPFAYVGARSCLANGVTIRAHAVLEHGTIVGERVIVAAGAVIGGDGFGYAVGDGDIAKIPQRGHVVLEDDVEIGTLSNVDRGSIDETRIGRGTKLDSLVHVGHNVKIGEYGMLCGQVGIAGSAKIGNWVIFAGQSAVNGHIEVGDRVVLGGRGVIDGPVKEPGAYHGFPAQPSKQHWREQSYVRRLPKIQEELRSLRAQVKALTEVIEELVQAAEPLITKDVAGA